MLHMNLTARHLILVLLVILCSNPAISESKRVHVYQLPQQTWNVRPGDTLSGIAAALLPGNPEQQRSLMQSILDINPQAFINDNPNRLLAHVKLILPGTIQTHSVPKEKSTTRVQQFNWGSIQRHDQ
jgi:Tfp pilus assembly protein FimV